MTGVIFWAETVPADHWLWLEATNAITLLRIMDCAKYKRELKLLDIPAVLHKIEEALASPSALKPYVRQPVDIRMVKIEQQEGSSVVKLNYGVPLTVNGLSEEFLRRKLARLYILITAAMDAGVSVYWRTD